MKCSEYAVERLIQSGHGVEYLTLEQFHETGLGETHLGKLFMALAEERAWSSEYDVKISYGNLTITHKTFQTPLVIRQSSWAGWAVRRVEVAIREHLDEMTEDVLSQMAVLQQRAAEIDDTRREIDKAKARAALAAAFPEAGEFAQFSPETTDMFCFGRKMDETPTYLVRMVGHEPAGVARVLDMSAIGWHLLKPGIGRRERHGYFWAALAQAFAERELLIPEGELRCEAVVAVEKPWEAGQTDRYVVEKVVLNPWLTGRPIIVTFGSDNLPARAEFVPQEAASGT